MRGARFSEEQIITILKEAEGGAKVTELCRRHGISDATFYTWRNKYGGLEVSEMRRLRQLEEENRRLKSMDSHRSARSSPRRSPVFMDRSTAGVRWSPKCGRDGSSSYLRCCRHALADSRAARISASRALSPALSRDSSW